MASADGAPPSSQLSPRIASSQAGGGRHVPSRPGPRMGDHVADRL